MSSLARFAGRLLTIGFLGLAMISSSGCSAITGLGNVVSDARDCCDDFMIGYRNRAFAEKAWIRHKPYYADHPYLREFNDGFIAGYLDVASGGNGCCPVIAPEEYWGWRYQTTHGYNAVNGWFEGFPQGAKAAEQDGIGHLGKIHTNGTVTQVPQTPLVPVEEPDVANPFYPDEEYVPVPVPNSEPERTDEDLHSEEVEFLEPESVFNQAMPEFPVVETDDTEPLSPSEIARHHKAAVTTRMAEQAEESQDAADVLIEDLFGSSFDAGQSESDTPPLPFTIE